ncbi:MAG: carboxypeptidase-like regulatory domain-containing protein [Candidatus Sulfotelmatobacter sp.]
MKDQTQSLLARRWFLCFSHALMLFFVSTSWAQYTTARLGGMVTDPSGAVISGASITVRDLGTGYTQSTSTTAAGQYLFPSLPVGNYQVTVSMAGYTSYVQKGIVLSLGQAATQNVQLQVGTVSQEVVVNALILTSSG